MQHANLAIFSKFVTIQNTGVNLLQSHVFWLKAKDLNSIKERHLNLAFWLNSMSPHNDLAILYLKNYFLIYDS